MGPQAETQTELPDRVSIAWDGLSIDI